MSGNSGDCAAHDRAGPAWDTLSSEHERLVLSGEDPAALASAGPSRWAELASQRERLVESGAPPGGLTAAAAPVPRLVVRAA